MAASLFFVFFTLLMVIARLGVPAWLGLLRVSPHLRRHPEAVKPTAEHVITPLLLKWRAFRARGHGFRRDRAKMSRFSLPLLFLALIGAFLLWRGGKLTGSGSGEIPHDPSTLAEIRQAGGFWKLLPEQQAGVRYRYVQELQLLLEQVNQRMQAAQFSGDLPACYVYRTMILQLQNSIARAVNASCDPTAEQAVLVYVSVALAR
jgi:hypothetical protein